MNPYNAQKQADLAHARVLDARILRSLQWAFFSVFSALLLLGAGWWLTGCATHMRTASVSPASGNIARLQARPDAVSAVNASPGFVLDALDTIADLESELKEAKAARP
ncbi:MAG: hypothetical protein ACAI35_03575 [Candidatus Methylacidiphilales bacterium]